MITNIFSPTFRLTIWIQKYVRGVITFLQSNNAIKCRFNAQFVPKHFRFTFRFFRKEYEANPELSDIFGPTGA